MGWGAASRVSSSAQLVPVERTNPPVEAEIVAEPEVHALLRRACYDCHSHETVWPWYAWVAPVSWLVAHDVDHAREELDFSRFESYDAKRAAGRSSGSWPRRSRRARCRSGTTC